MHFSRAAAGRCTTRPATSVRQRQLRQRKNDVAESIALAEGLTLTPEHWDVIEYLRDAYYNHNGEQPNNRAMLKAMQEKWLGRKVDNKTLFDLYPGNPSKQAGKIAGLPESLRKGGY
jgi:tRNA 2-thiouridine synthesizing protein E